MHTLFDFMTHIKGIEYLIAVSAILGFIVFWEVLKPRPFRSLADSAREDIRHIRSTGYSDTMRSVGKIAAAPFIGLAYVALLPLSFVAALGIAALNVTGRLLGANASFGWRPVEAYFAGKKSRKDTSKGEGS